MEFTMAKVHDDTQGNGVLTHGPQDEMLVSLFHSWRCRFLESSMFDWVETRWWSDAYQSAINPYWPLFPTPAPFPHLPYYRFTDVITSRFAASQTKRRHTMWHFTKYYVSHTNNFFLSLYRYWCFLKVAWIMHIARFNVCQLSRRQKNMQ